MHYQVTYEPLASDVPAICRLRKHLKNMLRRGIEQAGERVRLRVVDVREVAPDADRAATGRESGLAGNVEGEQR